MANDGSLLGQSGEIKKAIESIASNIVEENTRSCFRIVKAKVTTAINNGKIGVKVPPNDLELFLPYSSACNNLAVGDLCWVALIFSSWKNAIVWQPIKFDGTGGGGGNINIINTGTGNAITSITANGLDLTVDKGASFQPLHTYLTQISSIANNLTGLIKLTNGTISLDSTSYATTADLAKKVNDMTIGLYNGNAGNPKPIKFMSVNYSACDSNNGVFVKVSMVSGHGNGVSYTFLQDATFNVSYNGTVSVEMFKYFGASVTYNSVSRQYGDIFYVIDTVNKIVDFYCLMGQYSTMYQSPYKKLNSSTKGTITQYTTATVYSSGTQVFASGGDIVVMPDLAAYQPINANLTSIGNLATNITGLIKMTNGVASLDTTSYAPTSSIPTQYLKDASTSGTTLTLTKQDGTTVTFSSASISSIDGLGGGQLTSPLKISGGDSATASKIILDNATAGQITNNGTQTLFGFTSNNTNTLTLGHSSYALAMRGSGTRPKYNSNDVALYSDLANYIPLTGSSAITGSLIPNTDNSIDLGGYSKQYRTIYSNSFVNVKSALGYNGFIIRQNGYKMGANGAGSSDTVQGLGTYVVQDGDADWETLLESRLLQYNASKIPFTNLHLGTRQATSSAKTAWKAAYLDLQASATDAFISTTTDFIPNSNAAYDLGRNGLRWRNLYVQNGILDYGQISERGVDADTNYKGWFLIGYTSMTNCWAPVNATITAYDWDTEQGYFTFDVTGYFTFSSGTKGLSGHIACYKSGGAKAPVEYSVSHLRLVLRTTNTSADSGTNRVEIWYHQTDTYGRHTFKFEDDFGFIRTSNRTLWTKVKVSSNDDKTNVSGGVVKYLTSTNDFPTFIPESSWSNDTAALSVFQAGSYTKASIFNNNLYDRFDAIGLVYLGKFTSVTSLSVLGGGSGTDLYIMPIGVNGGNFRLMNGSTVMYYMSAPIIVTKTDQNSGIIFRSNSVSGSATINSCQYCRVYYLKY